MNITVLGLGYVGCISAGCLAQQWHRVFGVDVNPVKVDLINQGKSPIVERYIGEIIREGVSNGQLTATVDAIDAIAQSDISLICVGTPSQANGSLDLQYVRNVSREIGQALHERKGYHVAVVRSTVLPGSVEAEAIPLIEQVSGKRIGRDFGVCVNPEFLREGSAVDDYWHPPFSLIGAWDKRSGDLVEAMYKDVNAPVIRSDIRTVEMVKYASNVFHALKITFANEIGVLCGELGIDSHKMMDIFLEDSRLNISPKYLRPGFAFGGSCLPKDIRAIVHRAKSLDLDLQVLNAILHSNERHIERAFRIIQRSGLKKVGILGLSFKSGTDDLRESPMVHLVEKLLGKGYAVLIYDRNVSTASLSGANKQYIEQIIPHISTLLVSEINQVLTHAEVLVIGTHESEFREILGQLEDGQQVIDLVRIDKDISELGGNYQGICW